MNYWQDHRIRLRAIEPADAETFYRWNYDSDRARWLDFLWPPTSLDSVRAWAAEQSRKHMENDAFHWMIETLDGTPVGTIATHHCDLRSGTFSYGVDVVDEQRRKGYASSAVWLVLGYYFDQLRYQKATIEVHSDNEASLALHDRLGFLREGCVRRTVYQNGQYLDTVYFGMTVEEYREKRSARLLQSPEE